MWNKPFIGYICIWMALSLIILYSTRNDGPREGGGDGANGRGGEFDSDHGETIEYFLVAIGKKSGLLFPEPAVPEPVEGSKGQLYRSIPVPELVEGSKGETGKGNDAVQPL